MTPTKKRFSGVLPQTEKTTASGLPTDVTLQFRGFQKGLDQILHKDYKTVIGKIREALGVNSRAGLLFYRRGDIRLRAEQAVKIQQIFHSYGVTEIWDA